MDTYIGTLDRLLAVGGDGYAWGALEFDGVEDTLAVTRGGVIGSKPWTVPFSVPLILAPNAVFQRTDLLYVLIDASGSTVNDFVVLRVGESTCKRIKLGELCRRSPEFLDKMLALVHRPGGRPVYYEWMRVNPFNATGTTYIEDAALLKVFDFSDAEIAAHVHMVRGSLPHAVAEHPDLCPPHPKDGYVIYKDLVALEQRRIDEDAMLEAMGPEEGGGAAAGSAWEAPGETEREMLFETKFVGNVPKGAEEVATQPGDDALRSRATEYNFDFLMKNWSTRALRQFLHVFRNNVFRGDFRLVRLHTIFMKRTVPGGLDAMCCMFEEGELTVWVDPAKLKATRGIIEGMVRSNPRGARRAELVRAVKVIEHNEQVMKDFVEGTGRPPSPNRWTEAEAEKAIIDQQMMVSGGKRESKLDSLRRERQHVESAVRDKAANQAAQGFGDKTVEELEAETERLTREMLDSEDNYRMLVSKIDRVERGGAF